MGRTGNPDRMNSRETMELVKGARQGSRAAFTELVRLHQGFVYGIAFQLLWDANEAEDVVQETFVRIWRNLARFDTTRSFTTWAYAIATNRCRDRLRERQRRPSTQMEPEQMNELEGPADVSATVNAAELQEIIRRLTERLPLKQRLVFTLRDLQDLSVREVAAIVRISEASVKTNLHLARRKLRRELTQEYSITGVTS